MNALSEFATLANLLDFLDDGRESRVFKSFNIHLVFREISIAAPGLLLPDAALGEMNGVNIANILSFALQKRNKVI